MQTRVVVEDGEIEEDKEEQLKVIKGDQIVSSDVLSSEEFEYKIKKFKIDVSDTKIYRFYTEERKVKQFAKSMMNKIMPNLDKISIKLKIASSETLRECMNDERIDYSDFLNDYTDQETVNLLFDAFPNQ